MFNVSMKHLLGMDKKVPVKKEKKEEGEGENRTILWFLILAGFLIYVVVRYTLLQ